MKAATGKSSVQTENCWASSITSAITVQTAKLITMHHSQFNRREHQE